MALRIYIHNIVYIIGFANMFNLCFGFDLAWKNGASIVVPRLLGQHSRMLLIYLGVPQ